MRRRDLLKALAALPVGASPFQPARVAAQSSWPMRPVTLVVPFPPGGQADLAARPVAEALRDVLGHSVVVQNRGGAGGKIGNAAVAHAEPDGHTLLVALSSLAVLPEADRLFDRPPAYEVSDLLPIARILADPTLLAVPAGAPWRSVAEFVDDATKRPGVIAFASSGPYGTLHIAMEMFAAAARIKLLHVPYQGAGPALQALLGGAVQALASAPGVLKAQTSAGQLRILANWGADRIAAFPEVPTFRELGYSEVEFYIWAGLFAPRRITEPVVTRLREAMRSAMQRHTVVRIFENAGSVPAYQDAPEFARFVQTDSERLVAAVRRIGKVE